MKKNVRNSSTQRLSVLTLVLLVAMGGCLTASSQTFKVLHSFTGQGDGYSPFAGLAIDARGTLYGTARYGGTTGNGTVFRLTPSGSGWLFNTLLAFDGTNGGLPTAQLIFGRDGSLYGTTAYGGSGGEGTVFNLKPQPRFCGSVSCPWDITILQSFNGLNGFYPLNLAFDQAGNLYGVTADGGEYNAGVVFELTRSGGSWSYRQITAFAGSNVSSPNGVVPDQNGNLYGTALGAYPGVLFEVTNSGQVQILKNFSAGTGIDPSSGLIFDSAGNLYGQTLFEGPAGGGTVFEVSPSGGSWALSTVHGFPGTINNGPIGAPSLMMDAQGNIYGTTAWNGAYNYGEVFKLTPSAGGGYTATDLHDFTGQSDGCYPWSNVVMDSTGNLYGTTSACGENLYNGVVWEITP